MFLEDWGWYVWIENVKEVKGVTFNDVLDLPVIEFLNTVAYVKAKGAYQQEQQKKMRKKLKSGRPT